MTESPEEIRCQGLGVSEGIVIGQVLRMHDGTDPVYRWSIEPDKLQAELQRLRVAAKAAGREVLSLKEKAEHRFGKDHAYIFDAHLLLLEDKKLIGDIENYITTERVNAEWAVKVVGDSLLYLYSEIKDEYLRERRSDVDDVMQRLLIALGGGAPQDVTLSEDAVIVAQDLLPSAVANLDLEHARALATDSGGWTSHTAILARGVGIPAVVGLRDFFRLTRTGDRIIVDSTRNQVILHPSNSTLELYAAETASYSKSRPKSQISEAGPVRTTDGLEVTLRANVEVPSEFEGVEKFGASGVGLYRSEFLLSHRGEPVSETEQLEAYQQIARVAGAEGAVIRLFDLGGDNLTQQFQEAEKNPALGLRAIRFVLAHEDIMRVQLRAILRAGADGNLRIVLPMVADVSDVKRARKIIDEEAANLKAAGVRFGVVKVGAMIEVPSAVVLADDIARTVDFFELGTNDLVQYTLAVDRGNDEVAGWFRTLHPAVLRSIDLSLQAAARAGIPAIVCGEMASTPAYVALLLGLGATELSMTPASIPRVRRTIAAVDLKNAKLVAAECLACDTADDVEELVRQRLAQYWPGLFNSSNLPRRNS